MPIVEVTHDPRIAPATLRALAHAVSLAVECPEEPYDGDLRPGDVDVRSKWFASRAEVRQERCDRLRGAVVQAAGTTSVGIYLTLPVAAWAEGEAGLSSSSAARPPARA
jgi:hypothetical protein